MNNQSLEYRPRGGLERKYTSTYITGQESVSHHGDLPTGFILVLEAWKERAGRAEKQTV